MAAQSDDIGPNFNQAQFIRMLKLDSQAAVQRKCRKIGGEGTFEKAMEAIEQGNACFDNWMEPEEFDAIKYQARVTNDYKPLIKK